MQGPGQGSIFRGLEKLREVSERKAAEKAASDEAAAAEQQRHADEASAPAAMDVEGAAGISMYYIFPFFLHINVNIIAVS